MPFIVLHTESGTVHKLGLGGTEALVAKTWKNHVEIDEVIAQGKLPGSVITVLYPDGKLDGYANQPTTLAAFTKQTRVAIAIGETVRPDVKPKDGTSAPVHIVHVPATFATPARLELKCVYETPIATVAQTWSFSADGSIEVSLGVSIAPSASPANQLCIATGALRLEAALGLSGNQMVELVRHIDADQGQTPAWKQEIFDWWKSKMTVPEKNWQKQTSWEQYETIGKSLALANDDESKLKFQTLRIRHRIPNKLETFDFETSVTVANQPGQSVTESKKFKIPYKLVPSLEVMPGSLLGPDGTVCKADWWIHPAKYTFQAPELGAESLPDQAYLDAAASLDADKKHADALGLGLPTGEMGLEAYVAGGASLSGASCIVWHAMRHVRLPRPSGEDSVQGMFTGSHVRMVVRDLRLTSVHRLYPTRYSAQKESPPKYDDWRESPELEPKPK
jgi:hypothetical protein